MLSCRGAHEVHLATSELGGPTRPRVRRRPKPSPLDPSRLGQSGGVNVSRERAAHPLPVPDAEYRVMLLRRLRLPLPLALKRCRCGGRLEEYGDHRSACTQVGLLARRAGLFERAAARTCKEAGSRLPSHVALRDLNLDVPAGDKRPIDVVANGARSLNNLLA